MLPHKVVEILNQISVFDANDPKYAKEDPFDFEIPYKSDNIKAMISEMSKSGQFDPEGFFFLTCRSTAVGCCMVLEQSEGVYKI